MKNALVRLTCNRCLPTEVFIERFDKILIECSNTCRTETWEGSPEPSLRSISTYRTTQIFSASPTWISRDKEHVKGRLSGSYLEQLRCKAAENCLLVVINKNLWKPKHPKLNTTQEHALEPINPTQCRYLETMHILVVACSLGNGVSLAFSMDPAVLDLAPQADLNNLNR